MSMPSIGLSSIGLSSIGKSMSSRVFSNPKIPVEAKAPIEDTTSGKITSDLSETKPQSNGRFDSWFTRGGKTRRRVKTPKRKRSKKSRKSRKTKSRK
jgi:hypothetical protein